MTATATYESEELRIEFQCELETTDYGVEGSPTFRDPIAGTEEITSLYILGVEVNPMVLPVDLRRAMTDLIDHYGLEWEE